MMMVVMVMMMMTVVLGMMMMMTMMVVMMMMVVTVVETVVVVETVMMHYQQATPLFCSRPEKPQGKGGGTRFEPLHAMNFFYTGRFNDGVMSTSLWENLFSLFEFFFKT
jgi:Na+(H+)/acetate symporter ActP